MNSINELNASLLVDGDERDISLYTPEQIK